MKVSKLLVRNGTIALPKALARQWENSIITLSIDEDILIVQRENSPSFWSTWEKVKGLRNKVSKNDIRRAVKAARKKN